ncbi:MULTISPECIES: alpha/beta hydrolase [Halorubrum]|uniref:Alpha/beta hydrolase n=1 Tax=Halorubrum ezzemoulense TaxID=337243 RepID=A0A256KER8_HALEZ|nr:MULTISPECIES: alpha/beta hydrolase [Halorubrum]OYR79638.1 alpha/beta hydrolase [Halorubrum ezzemoulense]PHQ41651.1 alpha/beta hydrolase [Halorubrum sp. C191]QAY20328.1 alpha/beta hydrolase [Halorubrum ezzemoulense]
MSAEQIDPQAERVAARQSRVPLPHGRYRLKLLRRLTDPLMRIRNRDPPSVGATESLTLPGPEDDDARRALGDRATVGDLDARLYLPAAEPPYPTVVFFHGGGFVLGSVETHDWLCRHLTRESGCAVLSVEYRLAPEHPFPAAVADAYAAVERAADATERLRGTGDLAVAGDSAGGTLAAVTALMAAERDGPDIARQALLYPGIGVDPDQESMRKHAGTVLSRADIEWFSAAYYRSDIHRRNPYADPINAGDLSGVAPATVVTAGFDPLRDGGRAYAEQLVADGVATRYENYPAMVHGFMTMPEVDRARDAIASVGGDLADAFGD